MRQRKANSTSNRESPTAPSGGFFIPAFTGQAEQHPPKPETKIDNLPAALNELEQAANLEQLQNIFGRLWKQASPEQKAVIKEKYDSLKADHEAAAG